MHIIITDDRITELSRNLLTEIAYQSLPPSGIPVPIPKLMITAERNRVWKNQGYTNTYDIHISQHSFWFLLLFFSFFF